MPGRVRRAARVAPPALPDRLDPAPDELGSGDSWDGVAAGAAVAVPDEVTDVALREVTWTDGVLAGRTLVGLRARDVRFVRCDLSGAVLDGALLERVEFDGCRMTGVVLSDATLRDVVVREGAMRLANLRMARLERVLVESSSCQGLDLYQARLRSCGLLRCDLTGADLRSATFDQVDLHGSVLADLGGADALRGTRIAPDQMVPLGAALLAAVGVEVTDREAMAPER